MKRKKPLNFNKFTLLELMIVIAIIGILVSMLLPSLHKAKEEAMFAVCTSNRGQNYKAMVQGWTDNNGRLPQFLNAGQHNPENPKYDSHDWAGLRNRTSTQVINPVAESYAPGFKNLVKCPSLKTGELEDQTYSNGGFDYAYPVAYRGLPVAKIATTLLWQSQEMSTPLIVEESPRSLNNRTHESSFGNSDKLGKWHKFGKSTGYTTLTGNAVVVQTHAINYNAGSGLVMYEGQSSTKSIGSEAGLDSGL
ncbi:MAG: type II secretion system GspH family protein [Lentisphaeraceae bacterium]|nr:type II secretion system GspH family protein [Lentisphaeraceae bacterium]